MSYIESSLGNNEVLHYRARFHWFYKVAAWSALIVGALVAMLALTQTYAWLAVVLLLIGATVWLSIMMPIWTTEIGVTNQRVVYKTGLVNRKTSELQLRSIEEVQFEQDFWGRVFDFGKLEIHGTGDDAIFLPAVAEPIAFRAALQEAIGAAQGGDAALMNGAPRAGAADGMRARPA